MATRRRLLAAPELGASAAGARLFAGSVRVAGGVAALGVRPGIADLLAVPHRGLAAPDLLGGVRPTVANARGDVVLHLLTGLARQTRPLGRLQLQVLREPPRGGRSAGDPLQGGGRGRPLRAERPPFHIHGTETRMGLQVLHRRPWSNGRAKCAQAPGARCGVGSAGRCFRTRKALTPLSSAGPPSRRRAPPPGCGRGRRTGRTPPPRGWRRGPAPARQRRRCRARSARRGSRCRCP